MARPKKVVETGETLDEFIERVIAEHGVITAATFPDTERMYQHKYCGFLVTPGPASARLTSGDTVR